MAIVTGRRKKMLVGLIIAAALILTSNCQKSATVTNGLLKGWWMMGDSKIDVFFVGVVVAAASAISFIIGGVAGNGIATNRERNAAIEAGVGRWTVDKTGKTTFEYGKDGG